MRRVGSLPYCHAAQIVEAGSSVNGLALYEIGQCASGAYAVAFTADGALVWVHKVGSATPPQMPTGTVVRPETPAACMNPYFVSICESVTMGTEQWKVHDSLNASHFSFNEGAAISREWIIDSGGIQCVTWFKVSLHVKKNGRRSPDSSRIHRLACRPGCCRLSRFQPTRKFPSP